MSTPTIESNAMERLSRILAQTVIKYFDDAEHRRDFEIWYEKTYGKKYVWKTKDKQSDVYRN